MTDADDTLLTSLANNLTRIIVEPMKENFEPKDQVRGEDIATEDQKQYGNF